MIIQCKQCRTKFRFDDSMMQGNGVWLRCSRCGHVYFQDNPLAKPETDLPSEPDRVVLAESAPAEKNAEFSKETPSVFHRDGNGVLSSDKIMEARKRIKEEINLDIENTQGENIGEGEKEIEQKKLSAPKSSGKAWKIALWSVLVIVIIPALIYFFVFPQYGDLLTNIAGKYFGMPEPAKPEMAVNQMVKLQDVRHRMINNYILGQIGVVEGTAVNRADYPISRIMIKGEILDAYSVVLGEHTIYAGNVLTDEELMNLSEEEILTKLSLPEGVNNSNDKIMPTGQIPFMIVFFREQAGVIKTTVMPIGAERLL
ncbi:MAG: zinc-ribbon domain-containing protein [Deltaproteobacteria bacterium]|nr:zinc-ribbon domain-containing protein [Deltaproteobacteria bacterium]